VTNCYKCPGQQGFSAMQRQLVSLRVVVGTKLGTSQKFQIEDILNPARAWLLLHLVYGARQLPSPISTGRSFVGKHTASCARLWLSIGAENGDSPSPPCQYL
jgi:hypothetical protein